MSEFKTVVGENILVVIFLVQFMIKIFISIGIDIIEIKFHTKIESSKNFIDDLIQLE
jgi:hypothetical protein